MELPRGRGRPRKVSDDERLDREREMRRRRYHRKKEKEEGEEEIETNPGGRPRKEGGTEKELETLKRRQQRYAEGNIHGRGRPRTIDDPKANARERSRRYRESKKDKLLKVKLFPTHPAAKSGEGETDDDDDDDFSNPLTPILRSPSRVIG